VSKRSKLNIYEKYQHYTLTLPIQLHPNCANEDGSDGDVKLIAEGLGLREEEEFLVEGIDPKVCKDYSKYIKKKEKELEKKLKKELKEKEKAAKESRKMNESIVVSSKKSEKEKLLGREEKNVTINKNIGTGKEKIISRLKGIVVYEDNSQKAKRLIPLIMVVVFGLIIFILTLKKG